MTKWVQGFDGWDATQLINEIERLTKERDEHIRNWNRVVDQLATCQRDAERYRFVRDGNWPYNPDLVSVIQRQQNSVMDERIDAAIAAMKEQRT